jgi:hypothetical protein
MRNAGNAVECDGNTDSDARRNEILDVESMGGDPSFMKV